MKPMHNVTLLAITLGCLLIPSQTAFGRGGAFGTGETIDYLTKLPKSSPEYAKYNADARRLFNPLDGVGYKYTQFHIFVPVWTWGGEYVVYSGKEYIAVGTDAKTVAETLGVSEAELPVPFFYRYPFGIVGFGIVVLFFGGCAVIGRAAFSRKLQRLLADPRYKEGLRLALNSPANGLNMAVDYLVAEGIPLESAQKNMQLLLAHGESISV